jgi:hypothetical protein
MCSVRARYTNCLCPTLTNISTCMSRVRARHINCLCPTLASKSTCMCSVRARHTNCLCPTLTSKRTCMSSVRARHTNCLCPTLTSKSTCMRRIRDRHTNCHCPTLTSKSTCMSSVRARHTNCLCPTLTSRGVADKLLLLRSGRGAVIIYLLISHILRERVQVVAYRESLQGVNVLVIYRGGGLSGLGITSENHRGRRGYEKMSYKLIWYNYFRRQGTIMTYTCMLAILTFNKQ